MVRCIVTRALGKRTLKGLADDLVVSRTWIPKNDKHPISFLTKDTKLTCQKTSQQKVHVLLSRPMGEKPRTQLGEGSERLNFDYDQYIGRLVGFMPGTSMRAAIFMQCKVVEQHRAARNLHSACKLQNYVCFGTPVGVSRIDRLQNKYIRGSLGIAIMEIRKHWLWLFGHMR